MTLRSTSPAATVRTAIAVVCLALLCLTVSTASAAAPVKLTTRPELRSYACLHASQGYTGFAEPAIRFILRPKGVWIDRTFKEPKKARWAFKAGITTLFTTKGTRLERFTHWRDSSGKYLVEEPRGSDPLICR